MSQDNAELVRRTFDAFNRRDLDAFLALCHRDVEFVAYAMQLEGGDPYCGHEGVRAWWGTIFAVYPDFRADIEELRDLGDLTITRVRMHGRGVESDAPMDQEVWLVARPRDGKVIWWRFFRIESEAFEAAGLRE
jgi:ketosteroid isomerase-like protein